jgi:hypothetical protein
MRNASWKHGLALVSSLLWIPGSAAAKQNTLVERPRAVFFPARGVHSAE